MANQAKINNTIFGIGDKVVVYQKIQEEKKMRTQPFEGIVISIKGRGENKMFTVRRIAAGGIGVERIWPVSSPWIDNIRVKKKRKAKRAKLYYLRQKLGEGRERIKIKEKVREKVDVRQKPRKAGRKTRRKTLKKK